MIRVPKPWVNPTFAWVEPTFAPDVRGEKHRRPQGTNLCETGALVRDATRAEPKTSMVKLRSILVSLSSRSAAAALFVCLFVYLFGKNTIALGETLCSQGCAFCGRGRGRRHRRVTQCALGALGRPRFSKSSPSHD